MYVIIKTLAFCQKTVSKFEQNINILKYFKISAQYDKILGIFEKKVLIGRP